MVVMGFRRIALAQGFLATPGAQLAASPPWSGDAAVFECPESEGRPRALPPHPHRGRAPDLINAESGLQPV